MGSKNMLVEKVQSACFKINMRLKGIFGLPAQTRKDIAIFKTLFDLFSNDGRVNIFEWGSGFSTMYYADYLRRTNGDFQWHSIDNNKFWHEKVRSKVEAKGLQKFVELHVKEFPPFWEKPGWDWKNIPPPCGVFGPTSENEKDYVNFPKSLDKKFDVIIIDARFR